METSGIPAAALMTLSGISQAQSNVTIYGIFDAGLVRESDCPNRSVTAHGGGVASGSRLGFRGRRSWWRPVCQLPARERV